MTESAISANQEPAVPAPESTQDLDTTPAKQEETPAGDTTQAEHKLGDKVEAPGEKEDGYLYAGKYKTVEDMENGHKELMQKLTEQRPTAPDDYDFDFSENEIISKHEIDLKEDPLLNEIAPLMRKHNLSNEAAQEIVGKYLEAQLGEVKDPGELIKEAGGQEVVADANRFVDKYVPNELRDVAVMLGTTPDGIKFLNAIGKQMGAQNIPSDAGVAPTLAAEDLLAEANKLRKETPNFTNDRKAVAKYEKLMQQAAAKQLKR